MSVGKILRFFVARRGWDAMIAPLLRGRSLSALRNGSLGVLFGRSLFIVVDDFAQTLDPLHATSRVSESVGCKGE
jgi:hypothetical protein